MATVTLFKSKMSDSRVLLHSECHITTFLEGRPIKNQFKWQIELYLVCPYSAGSDFMLISRLQGAFKWFSIVFQ